MPRITTFLGLIALLTGAGCATLSESQCVASDWETIGFTDGANGRASAHLLKHQNACVKHGVVPDRESYYRGWHEGVVQYCTPENGFNQGERGASYSNVCPADLEASFHAAYQDGRQLYLAQAEINSIERSVLYKEQRLKHVKDLQISKEAMLISGNTTELQRHELLKETKDLAQEQGQLEAQIQELKVDAAVKLERLHALRHQVAYVY